MCKRSACTSRVAVYGYAGWVGSSRSARVVVESCSWDSFLVVGPCQEHEHVRRCSLNHYFANINTATQSHVLSPLTMKRSGSGRVARKVGAYDASEESAESSPN